MKQRKKSRKEPWNKISVRLSPYGLALLAADGLEDFLPPRKPGHHDETGDELYAAYCAWCEHRGRTPVPRPC